MSHESFNIPDIEPKPKQNPVAKIVRAAIAGITLMGAPKAESPLMPTVDSKSQDAREEQLALDIKEAEEFLGESEQIQNTFSAMGEASEKLKKDTHETNVKLEEAKLRVDERSADKMLKMSEEINAAIDASLSRGQAALDNLDEKIKGLQK